MRWIATRLATRASSPEGGATSAILLMRRAKISVYAVGDAAEPLGQPVQGLLLFGPDLAADHDPASAAELVERPLRLLLALLADRVDLLRVLGRRRGG
ncbi:MAG: hypothetical protein FJW90_04655 [Actinobacteria bacterium]|nr:hypothetical protein [Actinomycetota bacterium]